jgi:hypothetical protein
VTVRVVREETALQETVNVLITVNIGRIADRALKVETGLTADRAMEDSMTVTEVLARKERREIHLSLSKRL